MIAWIEAVALLLKVDLAVARERPSDLADVVLGIVAFAEREEFQELASQVLVRLGLGAIQAVEPAKHGSVAQDHTVQLADGRPPEPSNRLVLREHELGRIDLLLAGRVVRVPGQGHGLGQGVRREDEAVEPEHLHALDRRTPQRRVLHGQNNLGELAGRLTARSGRLAIEDAADRRLIPFVQVVLDLAPGRSQAGPAVQVRRAGRVPGSIGRRLIRLPATDRNIFAHCSRSFKVSVPRSQTWPGLSTGVETLPSRLPDAALMENQAPGTIASNANSPLSFSSWS